MSAEIDELIGNFEDRVVVLTLADGGRNMALKNRDAARARLTAAVSAVEQERDGLREALQEICRSIYAGGDAQHCFDVARHALYPESEVGK